MGKKEGFQLYAWNREYGFEKSILPASIKIAGKEILHEPMKLSALFEKRENEEQLNQNDVEGDWYHYRCFHMGESGENTIYAAAMETENLILNADITAEPDGLLKISFRIIPYWSFSKDSIPRIKKLYLDIPVKKEYAGLLHYWPNCESGVCLSGKVLNSFATPKRLELPFKPYLWLGWEYGGLGICCESDQNFELDDENHCITVEDRGEYVNIHIAILDQCPASWKDRQDQWGNNINPISYTLGIQATPVKEFPENHTREWRAFHLYDVMKHPIYELPRGNGNTLLEQIASAGTKWLILHEDWSVIQNYGMPESEEQFRLFSRACHELGMKLMVYFGYEVSTLLPGFSENCNEMLNKNVSGNFVGGWQREPMQRDFTVCYKGSYSDRMIRRVEYVMDELGVDGIYTDGTYVPWECANEAHGCGYRDAFGKLHHTYPIFAVREHVKKLYEAVHKRGGVIDTHQSSCCMMMTLSFADSYFDGENIQGMINKDIGFLRLDTFRCEFMGRNMGIPCNFIAYTGPDFTMRQSAAITLLHNIFPRPRTMPDLEFMSGIWKIYDEFGVEDAMWHPYWENGLLRTEYENVYLSYFERKGKYLLIIFSLNKEMKQITISLPGLFQISNLLDEESIIVNDGHAVITVAYGDAKVLLAVRSES